MLRVLGLLLVDMQEEIMTISKEELMEEQIKDLIKDLRETGLVTEEEIDSIVAEHVKVAAMTASEYYYYMLERGKYVSIDFPEVEEMDLIADERQTAGELEKEVLCIYRPPLRKII